MSTACLTAYDTQDGMSISRLRVKHMEGLDRLLARALATAIRENLGDRTVQKIEERLFEKFGISLTQSIGQFKKLDSILREFFGAGADGIEQRFLKQICEIKKIGEETWLHIENQELTKMILESLGDDDKKKILGALDEQAMVISEIIESCHIPQTSGYRKVHALIDEGMLVPSGHTITPDGKKVTKYKAISDNIKIDIVKNRVTVALRLKKEIYLGTILAVCA
ncbi:MAG: transcriptional regulator [Candidatus Nitrosotenuis sp.]